MASFTPSVCTTNTQCDTTSCDTASKVDTYLETKFTSDGPATDDDCKKQLAATGAFEGRTNWCKTTDDTDTIKSTPTTGSWCDWACAYGGTMLKDSLFSCTSTDCSQHFMTGKVVSCQSIKAMMMATCDMTQDEMDAVIDENKGNGCRDDGVTFSIPSASQATTAAGTTTPAPGTNSADGTSTTVTYTAEGKPICPGRPAGQYCDCLGDCTGVGNTYCDCPEAEKCCAAEKISAAPSSSSASTSSPMWALALAACLVSAAPAVLRTI